MYPPLFGEGYDTIKAITDGKIQAVVDNSFFRFISYREWVVLVFVAVICLLKAFSTSGYDLFIPLMLVSVIFFLTVKWFSPISPDLRKLAEEGKIFTREHDRNLLSLLHILDLIDKDIQVINVNASRTELAEMFRTGKRNMISVIDENRKLVGIISMDDVRPLLFNPDVYDMLSVKGLMKQPPNVISDLDTVVSVVKKFDETGAWNLPVVKISGEFVGFISKSGILNSYRQLLRSHSG
ncbi:CBS domain-containing protein [Dyadobacter arcticus]|uniref:CBS-domain-containing membrane protein n=1 Tax=Dyadobacter arcticus TaxID=1078754 RepID=A0ABX0UM29_9BACT|nr:CBS domain-containing protein [Dyadobacter arcticus]NIJ54053.1 CBS-domain-containing membrane protein [Dyadobacter arcticus]